MYKHKLNIPALFTAMVILAITTAGNVQAEVRREKEEFKKQQTQAIQKTEIHSLVHQPLNGIAKIEVYDPEFNLVYETADIEDLKLNDLLLKCDLIFEINNIHIFQLSR
jgi:hypothetical protein